MVNGVKKKSPARRADPAAKAKARREMGKDEQDQVDAVIADELTDQEQRYRKIWDSVAAIPPGRVLSYGQVAELAGMPRRARLVSKALKAAPEALQLPWFRVIRSDGSIAFPPGSEGFREQRRRLRAEGTKVNAQGKVESAHRQAAGASGDALDYLLWSPE